MDVLSSGIRMMGGGSFWRIWWNIAESGECVVWTTHMRRALEMDNTSTLSPRPPPALILIGSYNKLATFCLTIPVEERPSRMNIHIKAEIPEEEKDRE